MAPQQKGEEMSKERYNGGWISKDVILWQNKKMKNFDENKKRKLLLGNILKMKAVNKFCDRLLYIMNLPYKGGKRGLDFLTAAEKLDYLQRFCNNTKLRNNDITKVSEEELIKTHTSGGIDG